MLAILAAIAFAIAAFICFTGTAGLGTAVGIIAVGLFLLAIHGMGLFADVPRTRFVHRQP
jgi:hypothetical protein